MIESTSIESVTIECQTFGCDVGLLGSAAQESITRLFVMLVVLTAEIDYEEENKGGNS